MVDEITGTTDSNGKIAVRIGNEGLNVIAVTAIVKTPGDPLAVKQETISSLSFTLPHLPDERATLCGAASQITQDLWQVSSL